MPSFLERTYAVFTEPLQTVYWWTAETEQVNCVDMQTPLGLCYSDIPPQKAPFSHDVQVAKIFCLLVFLG